jgi:hypothetical protein
LSQSTSPSKETILNVHESLLKSISVSLGLYAFTKPIFYSIQILKHILIVFMCFLLENIHILFCYEQYFHY